MFSFAHALLLIAGLVLCPVRCMGSLAEIAGAPGGAGCSCCEAPVASGAAEASRQDESQPTAPGEDCGCGSCLCRGAVLAEDRATVGDADGPTGLDSVARLAVQDAPPTWRIRSNAFRQSPHACGRDVRILHQSFLI